ncbi:MAG: efflux RND transporter permease subunit [Acidobacteria bacterium]|nr:efflux RND transporter permease subunit [Acidobacteriota bacterium]
MLSALVRHSIQYRGIVTVLACLTVAYGIYSAAHARYDAYPEFAPPQVVVQTEAPGFSPEDVEALVTRPAEYALNGMPNLASIRSQSIQGLSVITLVFSDRTDIYRARQTVSERLAELTGRMPQGVEAPAMAPLTGATNLVLVLGLTSETRSLTELRTLSDWTLSPRLLSVPGVARVSIFGGDVKQLQIQVQPERLAAFHVSAEALLAAARQATGIRSAGFIDTPAQRIVLETRGQSLTPEQLGETVFAVAGGRSVRFKDVARVAEGAEPRIGAATIEGRPGVMLQVSSQYGANTLEVTERVEQALEELKPGLAAAQVRLHPDLFRPASFVSASIRGVGWALLIGGMLVAVVLFLFLFNLRTALISLTAIPLSLLTAMIVLTRLGETVNTLTLGGLAIAIGEVVDDAIIDVENIFRRLREAPHPLSPAALFRVVLDASLEVRGAVVYATFIVILVFLPVLTMSGVQGRLFAPLGWSYVLAILASLAVALTVTPALSYWLLPRAVASAREPGHVRRLKERYGRLLRWLGARPGLAVGGSFALCAAAIALIPLLGGEFLPEMREGHFVVHAAALPGTSLEETVRQGRHITEELLKIPIVRSVSQQVGRAEMSDDTWGTHYSEFHVGLKSASEEEAEQAQARIREAMHRFPGISFAVQSFLAERMDEIMSGVTSEVVVKVFGDDLEAIDLTARQVRQAVAAVAGAADVQVESPPGIPEIQIRLRRDRLRQFGFQPVQVLEAVQMAYQGAVVGQISEGARVFGVAVILEPESRGRPEGVARLMLQNAEGLRVPLGELAEVRETAGRYSIAHEGARRRQAVTCNVAGRGLASFFADIRRAVANQVKLPPGVYVTFGGAEEARSRAQSEILLYSLLAAAGIVLLLQIVFREVRNTLLVLVNLPFALVGGVVAAFLSGGELSVGSLVGFVTLFGITMRNSIMMMSHYEHLVRREGRAWNLETAIRGAAERLTPVLMTAVVAGLGLLPLALGSGKPGKEIEGPMAVVILGGLATSTALNLLVLPTLAVRFARFAPDDRR